jgi:hypothetical protein
MRAHLNAVMNYLLFTTEQQAMEEVRKSTASTRVRFSKVASLLRPLSSRALEAQRGVAATLNRQAGRHHQ